MKSKEPLNFEELISIFELDLKRSSQGWSGCCPIHRGDNPTAFKFYDNNVWQCFSHGCHEQYGCGVFGFIKGMLSGETEVDSEVVREWIEKRGELPYTPSRQFRITRGFNQLKPIAKKEQLEKLLQIPSPYYLDRGFSPFILKKFVVGDCFNKGKRMYGRAVVPIFDDSYNWVLGCSGRTIWNCLPKWLHTSFPKRDVLYNYWFAKNEAKRTKTLILTEGPAKVWRLEEAGFCNAMATFGTSIQLGQLKKIARLGVKRIIIAMDGDEAGEKAAKDLAQKLNPLYNTIITDWGITDIDETDKQLVRQEMQKVLRK